MVSYYYCCVMTPCFFLFGASSHPYEMIFPLLSNVLPGHMNSKVVGMQPGWCSTCSVCASTFAILFMGGVGRTRPA